MRLAFRWRPDRIAERFLESKLTTDRGTLTIAGALVALPDPQAHLGKAFIEVLRYPDEGEEYDRREEFRGAARDQIADATEFVMAELGTDLVVSGVRRYDLPKMPEVVLREAVANAVAIGHTRTWAVRSGSSFDPIASS